MPYTVVYFLTRKPSLTSEEFKDYLENKHVPMIKKLFGPLFPNRHTRRYLIRIDRKGFGGPANRDRPPLVVRGSPDDFDYDAITEMSFSDEKAFQAFYKAMHESEIQARMAEDEAHFLDKNKQRAVVVSETTTTSKS